MWEWFTTSSVWFFIASGIVLILFFFFQGRVKNQLVKAASEEGRKKIHRITTVAFWAIESIALGVIVLALVAIILSREGAHAIITPETIESWFLEHGSTSLIIIVTAFVLWVAWQRFLPPLLQRTVARHRQRESKEGLKKRTDTLLTVFMGAGKILIVIVAMFMILSEIGINIAPVLAGLGIAGIAVGFGAQYMIRDLIAGIFVIMENQYRVGDVAKVADTIGIVEEVNLRKTVLRDLDGIVHHVPNGEIRIASNYTRHFSRVNLDISVAYGTDLDFAIGVINRVCQEMAEEEKWSKVIKSTPRVLRVDKLGDSGIDIKILGDVKPLEQWNVMGELRLRLKKVFDAEGIEIPWPHTKVYFGNAPGDQK